MPGQAQAKWAVRGRSTENSVGSAWIQPPRMVGWPRGAAGDRTEQLPLSLELIPSAQQEMCDREGSGKEGGGGKTPPLMSDPTGPLSAPSEWPAAPLSPLNHRAS